MSALSKSASFEHCFWLQVMKDHATFIRDSLYPSEEEDIRTAKEFVHIFDSLLNELNSLSKDKVISFTKQTNQTVDKFKKFKLSIIKRHLTGNIKIHLPPTFINHMVNELEEYQLVMSYLIEGKVPPIFHELHHHIVWLADASGHAGAINDELDKVEQRLKKKSHHFAKHFDQFFIKAVELTGYLRANISSFPALNRFNNDVEVEIKLFQTFLHEIEEMELSDTILSTFSAQMADHMYREECYYLMKVAESSGAPLPDCDPLQKDRNIKEEPQ
ncbi:DUF2935 domain-containing protein [Gracilibacillus sp. YIM 98692]|uniref:DUF2935 domain-containing protein n=1 Tax=Gracilibacillus sp. YIM 98692 TaxID=2663532 RepID=UPI0023E3B306|nr:DUF2935 domain-containing protein [Gracilibacillus sp. YIM 98692]